VDDEAALSEAETSDRETPPNPPKRALPADAVQKPRRGRSKV